MGAHSKGQSPRRGGINASGVDGSLRADVEPGEVPEAVLRNDEIARRVLGREPNRVRYEGEMTLKENPRAEASPTKDEIEAREAAAAAAAVGRRAQKTRSVRK